MWRVLTGSAVKTENFFVQVKRLIGKYAPHLAGYGQQDCQVG